ncbi:MAG TPA: M20 family metallopeptidase [Anaerolineales bacterium]|nr:M20 family metallopeptidase [Anaerolineales bacterium]
MPPIPVSYFIERTNQLVETLRRYAEIESPSTDKAAVDRFGAVVAADLRAIGARVEIDFQSRAGDHFVGRFGAGPNGILILCHLDTVHDIGAIAKNPPRAQNGKLYGPGTIDMKGSIVQTLAALSALIENNKLPPRPITALFTSDEEIGSESSRALIERLGAESSLVLCMEPALTDGSLKTWRKGIGNFDIVVRGRSTHAGADHENGVNAVEEMAHQILALQRMTDYEKGTTVNVGVVGGGTRSNVVPDECRVEVDLRVMTPVDADAAGAAINSLKPVNPKAAITVTGGMNRPPMPRTENIAHAFEIAKRIASGLGMALTEGGTGGGSDANFIAPLGVPVLDGLGPIGNGAHSEREHVLIKSLPERTALLAGLLSEWPV